MGGDRPGGSSSGRLVFAAAAVAIAIVWGVFLPRWAQSDSVNERDRWLAEKGIEPAAMFYTDLPFVGQGPLADRPARPTRE